MYSYILVILFATLLFFYIKFTTRSKKKDKQRYSSGTHVIISGGSKGIGKALAKHFAELGTHVTIIARNENDLQTAKNEIEAHRKNNQIQQIRTVSLDLTKLSFPHNYKDITKQHQDVVEKILGDHDRCDILINCCGSSIPARFEDTSQSQFQYMMQVNYFSAVNLTRIILPTMKAQSLANLNSSSKQLNGGARIVFVSSICGLLSFFGYSGYSASKFALVGLAEALHMELRPFNIGVTISFPPDTDTPGFETENKIKPSLTSKMSEAGDVYSPDAVASALVSDIRAKKFYSTVGLENKAVLIATNTFMPTSFSSALLESVIAGPLKLAGYFIVRSWQKMVDDVAENELNISRINLKCAKKGNLNDHRNQC